MSTVTKAANAHTVVATGWTNPSNCYATTNDSTYATIATAKNSTLSGDFGFPAFTTGDIPDGSLINSVVFFTTYGLTATATGALVGLQARRNSTSTTLGSEITRNAASMADANGTATGCTLTDLRTANELRVRGRGTKGNSSTASTAQLDRLYVTVDYTAPVIVLPGSAALTATGSTPTVVTTNNALVSPGLASLAATGATPTVAVTANVLALPAAASLTATGATPTVTAPALSLPSVASLALSASTPSVAAAQTYAPDAAGLSVSGATPAVATPVVTAPDAASLTSAPATPLIVLGTVTLPDGAGLSVTGATPAILTPVVTQPDSAALTVATDTPTVSLPVVTQPEAAALTLTGAVPTSNEAVVVQPGSVALAVSLATPTVRATDNVRVLPDALGLVLDSLAPDIAITANVLALPGLGRLRLAGAVPLVTGGATKEPPQGYFLERVWRVYRPVRVVPAAASVALVGGIPEVVVFDDMDFLALVETLL